MSFEDTLYNMVARHNNRPHPEDHLTRTVELREDADVHGWAGRHGQSPDHETDDETQSWAERNDHE